MQEIERNIFIETTYPGVTLGALTLPHGTVLIDAPLRAEDARAWRAAMVNLGSSANRILVNLDAHPDRTLGARALECTVIAHHKTAQVFRNRPSIFKGQNVESGAEWETYSETMGIRWAIPDITFIQRISLHWGPPDIILEHHPGPSTGAIWAIVPEAKVIFVGDSVVFNQPPFLTNADVQAWMESLEILMSTYKDFMVISGRGGVVPNDGVRIQHTFLKNILKGMEKLSKRSAAPDATESLVANLIAEMNFPAHLEEQYVQRLRHGLNQYYARRYRSQENSGIQKNGDADQ